MNAPQLPLGLIVVIQFENDVREPFEVRIDRTVKRQLNVPRVKPRCCGS